MTGRRGRAGRRLLAGAVVAAVLGTLAADPGLARPTGADKSPEVPRCGPVVGLGTVRAPELTAEAWAVADAGSGKILASCRANDRLAPASTQKVLTALALLPNLDPKFVYIARKQDAEAEGSGVGLLPGHGYTIAQLAHGLILRSGNDAASALANAYGGWKPALSAMNAEAARLGAGQTTAMNPSGLDAPGQVSSAVDLATIFRAALGEPAIRRLFSTREADFPLIVERRVKAEGGGRKVQREVRPGRIGAIDPLVWNRYSGLVGAKTGYTTHAGRTYVAAVKRGDTTLIVALMGYSESTENEANTAYSWAFANRTALSGAGQLPEPRPAEDVPLGVSGDSGVASNSRSASGGHLPTTTDTTVAVPDSNLVSELTGGILTWVGMLILVGAALVVAAVAVACRGKS